MPGYCSDWFRFARTTFGRRRPPRPAASPPRAPTTLVVRGASWGPTSHTVVRNIAPNTRANTRHQVARRWSPRSLQMRSTTSAGPPSPLPAGGKGSWDGDEGIMVGLAKSPVGDQRDPVEAAHRGAVAGSARRYCSYPERHPYPSLMTWAATDPRVPIPHLDKSKIDSAAVSRRVSAAWTAGPFEVPHSHQRSGGPGATTTQPPAGS